MYFRCNLNNCDLFLNYFLTVVQFFPLFFIFFCFPQSLFPPDDDNVDGGDTNKKAAQQYCVCSVGLL